MPSEANTVPVRARPRPRAPCCARSMSLTSGQNTHVIPVNPHSAPAITFIPMGVRNRITAPKMFMMTRVEKATATRPVVRYWLPR